MLQYLCEVNYNGKMPPNKRFGHNGNTIKGVTLCLKKFKNVPRQYCLQAFD